MSSQLDPPGPRPPAPDESYSSQTPALILRAVSLFLILLIAVVVFIVVKAGLSGEL